NELVQFIYTDDKDREPSVDVDQSLYDGFLDNSDRKICEQIQKLSVQELKNFHPIFNNKKLTKLLLHFKARNYPSSLTDKEHNEWFEVVQGRIQEGENGYLSITNFYKKLEKLRNNTSKTDAFWGELEAYAESLL
ncbi:MAG TPA: exodeoxyribonuclease I, partial [Candidatus Thioglobus sp.]|nr:exodeoxyribonuclease I [Candidatus Thioglobus sp.]